MTDDQKTEIRKMLAELLCQEVDDVTDEKSLSADLGADSLDAVEIAMDLEEMFPIHIEDDAMVGIETVGQLVAMVEAKL